IEQSDHVRVDLLAVHRTRGEQHHVCLKSQYLVAIGRGLHAGRREADQLAGVGTRLLLAVDLDSNQLEVWAADDLTQRRSAAMAWAPNDYAVRPADTRVRHRVLSPLRDRSPRRSVVMILTELFVFEQHSF